MRMPKQARLAMGRAGRRRVEARFSLEAMIDAYRDLYVAAAPARPPAGAHGAAGAGEGVRA